MTALATISPKIDPLIRRLATTSDGEVIATVRALHRQLSKAGLSFHDLADLLPGDGAQGRPAAPPEPDSPEEFSTCLAAVTWLLHEHSQRLSPREYSFLMNMLRTLPRRPPSPKQATWICDLIERYRHG